MNKPRGKVARRAAPNALVFSLLETAEAVEARLEAVLSPTGLSMAKLAVLHVLVEAREPLPLSDLAERQHCVRSNITQLVDRLEKDGFVRRRADPDDRRSVRAVLTAAGERAHGQGMRALAAEQRAIMSSLGAGDAAALKGVLELLARSEPTARAPDLDDPHAAPGRQAAARPRRAVRRRPGGAPVRRTPYGAGSK